MLGSDSDKWTAFDGSTPETLAEVELLLDAAGEDTTVADRRVTGGVLAATLRDLEGFGAPTEAS